MRVLNYNAKNFAATVISNKTTALCRQTFDFRLFIKFRFVDATAPSFFLTGGGHAGTVVLWKTYGKIHGKIKRIRRIIRNDGRKTANFLYISTVYGKIFSIMDFF